MGEVDSLAATVIAGDRVRSMEPQDRQLLEATRDREGLLEFKRALQAPVSRRWEYTAEAGWLVAGTATLAVFLLTMSIVVLVVGPVVMMGLLYVAYRLRTKRHRRETTIREWSRVIDFAELELSPARRPAAGGVAYLATGVIVGHKLRPFTDDDREVLRNSGDVRGLRALRQLVKKPPATWWRRASAYAAIPLFIGFVVTFLFRFREPSHTTVLAVCLPLIALVFMVNLVESRDRAHAAVAEPWLRYIDYFLAKLDKLDTHERADAADSTRSE